MVTVIAKGRLSSLRIRRALVVISHPVRTSIVIRTGIKIGSIVVLHLDTGNYDSFLSLVCTCTDFCSFTETRKKRPRAVLTIPAPINPRRRISIVTKTGNERKASRRIRLVVPALISPRPRTNIVTRTENARRASQNRVVPSRRRSDPSTNRAVPALTSRQAKTSTVIKKEVIRIVKKIKNVAIRGRNNRVPAVIKTRKRKKSIKVAVVHPRTNTDHLTRKSIQVVPIRVPTRTKNVANTKAAPPPTNPPARINIVIVTKNEKNHATPRQIIMAS